jgi:biotin transport system substrate-specific component
LHQVVVARHLQSLLVDTHLPLAGASLEAQRAASWRALLLREALLLLAGTVFLSLTARIQVPLPFSPVPLTGQTLGVLLIGALYGPRRGALCVLAYIGEGLAGLPVFAGGRFGLSVLLGPTGGYIAGFVPAAFVAGFAGNARRPVALRFTTLLIASALVYVLGAPWLAFTLNRGLDVALMTGVLPFLLGDAIKSAIVAGVVPAGARLIEPLLPRWGAR